MIQPELPFTHVPVRFKPVSDLSRAKQYLKSYPFPGILPPDRVKEVLGLKTSAATLGRKFRAASTGNNPELLRSYYINDSGRKIAHYQYNHDHQGKIFK